MPNEEYQEKMVEKIIDLLEELNAEVLENVGKSINKIGKLTPTKAHQLVQQLMYGEDYNKIVRKLSKVTGLSKKEIEKIFIDTAKKNQAFSKQFYDAKKVPFIDYKNNKQLQKQVQAFSKATQGMYEKLTDSGFYIIDGKRVPIKDAYNHMLEKSLMSVTTGQTNYQEEMRKITNEMALKGIRTRLIEGKDTGTFVVDYASGKSRRLDSVLRMHLLGSVRTMSNKLQEEFGKQFGADGVEISVHLNPAPDHTAAQGHQFKFEEYKKLNKGEKAKDYKGIEITIDPDANGSYRPISTLNCQHYEWNIVLGVSKPRYTQEQLDKIIEQNEKGFTYNGKHYTNYQGTQLQRQLETKIRQNKDKQIVSRAIGDFDEVEKCQNNIRKLTKKYNELSKISGLPTSKQRMAVSGYHPVKIPDAKTEMPKIEKLNEILENKFNKRSAIFKHSNQYLDLTNNENINIYNSTKDLRLVINERKNIKKCWYRRERANEGTLQVIQTTSVIDGNVNPDATIWHELGHALDNYKGGDEYLSNNLDMRQAVYDYYTNNKQVPDSVVNYFKSFKEKANKEFEDTHNYQSYYDNFIENKIASGDTEWNISVYKKWKEENLEMYKSRVESDYKTERDKYYYSKNKTDMLYAQKLCLSDMFSSISKGEYNKQFCSTYGYHTTKYFNEKIVNPYTELFADFVSLKMTGCKEHLDFFKKECPDIYEQLEKLYKKIGDDLGGR